MLLELSGIDSSSQIEGILVSRTRVRTHTHPHRISRIGLGSGSDGLQQPTDHLCVSLVGCLPERSGPLFREHRGPVRGVSLPQRTVVNPVARRIALEALVLGWWKFGLACGVWTHFPQWTIPQHMTRFVALVTHVVVCWSSGGVSGLVVLGLLALVVVYEVDLRTASQERVHQLEVSGSRGE